MGHAHLFSLFDLLNPLIIEMLDIYCQIMIEIQEMIWQLFEEVDVAVIVWGEYGLVLTMDFADRILNICEENGISLLNPIIVQLFIVQSKNFAVIGS